jgi:hypothetical protein
MMRLACLTGHSFLLVIVAVVAATPAISLLMQSGNVTDFAAAQSDPTGNMNRMLASASDPAGLALINQYFSGY